MRVDDRQIRKALQDFLIPELRAIRGDLRALCEKLDRIGTRSTTTIDSPRPETVSLSAQLVAEIRRLDVRIDGVDRELRTVIRRRLAALEARRVS